jgi:hypothetical protein
MRRECLSPETAPRFDDQAYRSRVNEDVSLSVAPDERAPTYDVVGRRPPVRVDGRGSPGAIRVSRTRTLAFSKSSRWWAGAAARASRVAGHSELEDIATGYQRRPSGWSTLQSCGVTTSPDDRLAAFSKASWA